MCYVFICHQPARESSHASHGVVLVLVYLSVLMRCVFNVINLPVTAAENKPVWLYLSHVHDRPWCSCTINVLIKKTKICSIDNSVFAAVIGK